MTTTDDSSKPKTRPFALFKRIILWVGLACLLQFVVFAVIGVARGYSIQSLAPVWIMLAGVLLLAPFSRKYGFISFLTSAALIVYALVSISHGRHQEKADALFDEGKFPEAMAEYRLEIDTWYLRLCHNHREAPCMFRVALCQSELEDFGEARKTYADIVSMFRGYYRKRAEFELIAIDANLKKVAELETAIAGEEDDQEKAMLLFDLALAYRELNCTGKTVRQYETIQSLDVDERFQMQARRFAEDLQ